MNNKNGNFIEDRPVFYINLSPVHQSEYIQMLIKVYDNIFG